MAAAVILAAGRGSRLEPASSVPKPLLEFRGRPLVAWALDAARASGLAPVLLVVGHGADAVRAVAGDDVAVIDSPRWSEGISQSLAVALEAVEHQPLVSGVCVGLADQPLVGAEAYTRVAKAGGAGAPIAVATYSGVRGNPVWLDRSMWPAASALTGDSGARQLMDGREVEVDCTGTGNPADIDTLDDLHALEEST
jgi:molybdenum cofactor cytidylyltransferase